MKTLLMLLCICVGGFACAKEQSLTEKDFHRQIITLKSYAAEGQLMLRGFEERKVTTTFIHIHCEKVIDGLKDPMKTLEKPASGPMELKRKQALELANRLKDNFQQLQKSAANPAQVQTIRSEFGRIYDALQE